MEQKSEGYIYEYFADIKTQADLRREELKEKIDNYSDDIIKSIDNTQLYYTDVSEKIGIITENLEKSKNLLDLLMTQFDTFEINAKKISNKECLLLIRDSIYCYFIIKYNAVF